jgi:AraC-like DNA-binding protein/ligand-binding sensor protein
MKPNVHKLLHVDFHDIAESEELTDFFLVFSELAGIHFGGISNSTHTESTTTSCPSTHFNPLCTLIRSVPEGLAACKACDDRGVSKAIKASKPVKYICHAGLVDFALPLNIDDQLVATTTCGQILPEKPSAEGFEKFAAKIEYLNLDKQKLKKAYFASTYMTNDRIDAVLRAFTYFINYFNEVGSRLRSIRLRENYPELFEIKDFLYKHFRENISLRDLAKLVGLSESYCSRLFSKIEGKTITKYLKFLRLTEAKKLLRETDWSITDIAFKCGFNDLSYFNRSFHVSEGCSPREYRKKTNKASI